MTTYKNRLPQSALMGYISPAPHKTGAGISTLLTTQAHNRASGFFTCKASSHLFRIMVGRMGPLSGGPGSCVAGCGNPVRLTTPSFPPLGGELSQLTTQGYPSWQTANNATPAQTPGASTPRPKSTAACTAPAISLSSCTLTCCPKAIAPSRHRISQPSLVTWLTTCANYSYSPARTPRNPPNAPRLSGAFVHPVNREVWL
ncbi:hypothetical protein JR782_000986 [Salmonella enterica subsp. enterica serovar Eastbourne]|nr:hypothetical protein [Salmonella enterica subsp. enterica serovar Eastbourne]EHC5906678.1 hypothetical protein [Salmonella enterica subsp. enterica serovar Eastbourne]